MTFENISTNLEKKIKKKDSGKTKSTMEDKQYLIDPTIFQRIGNVNGRLHPIAIEYGILIIKPQNKRSNIQNDLRY